MTLDSFTRDFFARTMRGVALAVLLASGMTGLGFASASAQTVGTVRAPTIEVPDVDVDVDTPVIETPDERVPTVQTPRLPDSNGSLVFHGNYCGPGSRGAGLPPVDALDAACMHHDACSPPVGQGLPSCSCNARLTQEAALVARSPRTPDDLRIAAEFVSEGAKVLACR